MIHTHIVFTVISITVTARIFYQQIDKGIIMKVLNQEQVMAVVGGIWDLDNEPQEPELPKFEL